MKKTIYISILAFICTSNIAFGQVGIGTQTPDASAVLDVVASDKGFLAPQVALVDTGTWTLTGNAREGMLVYNTTDNPTLDPGYYFWDGAWQPTGIGSRTNIISDGVIPSILGYNPTGTHPASTGVLSPTVDGLTITNRRCVQWTVASGGNGHWYCGFTSGNNGTSGSSPGTGGMNWATAYKVGKQWGGYLVTITSNNEYQFILDNIIEYDHGTYNEFNNNIWIGNNKAINRAFAVGTPSPGIPIEFYWITGEESKSLWSNATTVEQNFADNSSIPNEPNNNGGNEGCSHIWANGMSSGMNALKLKWNDAPCTKTTFEPGGLTAETRAFNQLIIEFNQ